MVRAKSTMPKRRVLIAGYSWRTPYIDGPAALNEGSDFKTSAAESAAAPGDNSTGRRPATALDAVARRRVEEKLVCAQRHLPAWAIMPCSRGAAGRMAQSLLRSSIHFKDSHDHQKTSTCTQCILHAFRSPPGGMAQPGRHSDGSA